jgi:hypothetical protein
MIDARIVQNALLQLRVNGRIDARALDGQRRPGCWCGNVDAPRNDEHKLRAWTEHDLTAP